MKRRTPKAARLARKPPPEKASASGISVVGGGAAGNGSRTAHGSTRSEAAVPSAGEVSGCSRARSSSLLACRSEGSRSGTGHRELDPEREVVGDVPGEIEERARALELGD